MKNLDRTPIKGSRSMIHIGIPDLYEKMSVDTENKILFTKLNPGAIIPQNQHIDDVGLDVSIIRVVKKTEISNTTITYFGTGLAVKPPNGYYFDMVPRSSFHKTGWIVANGFGVIDPNYRGELMVACFPLDDSVKIPEFPMRAVQLVLRKIHKFPISEVEKLSETKRGSGGFGSTGKSTL